MRTLYRSARSRAPTASAPPLLPSSVGADRALPPARHTTISSRSTRSTNRWSCPPVRRQLTCRPSSTQRQSPLRRSLESTRHLDENLTYNQLQSARHTIHGVDGGRTDS